MVHQPTGYNPKYDLERLKGQSKKIYLAMKPGTWRTLGEISRATGAPEASVSACLRSFRNPNKGSHTVDKRRRGNPYQGLWEYKLTINPYTVAP